MQGLKKKQKNPPKPTVAKPLAAKGLSARLRARREKLLREVTALPTAAGRVVR